MEEITCYVTCNNLPPLIGTGKRARKGGGSSENVVVKDRKINSLPVSS